MGIGKRIREAREALRLTQGQLAAMIGVTASAITNYEANTSHPKEPILYKLIAALNVDANYLFQDSLSQLPKTMKAPAISSEALEIARAYEKTDDGTKASVRKLLDVRRPPRIPDAKAIKTEAEAQAQLYNQPQPSKK